MRAAALVRSGSPLRPASLTSYVTVWRATGSGTFTSPSRIRGVEPARLAMIVRNIGTTPIQITYATTDNTSFNSPFTAVWAAGATIPAGQEWVETPASLGGTSSGQAVFIRPVTNGDGLYVGVFTKIPVL